RSRVQGLLAAIDEVSVRSPRRPVRAVQVGDLLRFETAHHSSVTTQPPSWPICAGTAKQILTTNLVANISKTVWLIFCDRNRRSHGLCQNRRNRLLILARPRSLGRRGTWGTALDRAMEPRLFRTAQRLACH